MAQRTKVVQLYKSLLTLGKDYVHGKDYFRRRLHDAFMRHKNVTDPAKIELLLAYGEYVKKELEALRMLRRYSRIHLKAPSSAGALRLGCAQLGKDYPQGYEYFRKRLHNAFIRNKDEKDPAKIEKMIVHGDYIVKELEALYMLKKYRTLKRRYYNENVK